MKLALSKAMVIVPERGERKAVMISSYINAALRKLNRRG